MSEPVQQEYFNFLVPVTKELLRVDEVMTILRVEKDAVYALCDAGKLEVHKGDGLRSHYRITRRSVVAYLASTAKYVPHDLSDTIFRLASRLPTNQLAALVRKLNTLL